MGIKGVLITDDHALGRELFEAEEEDLFNELQALPRFALIRRFNDLIKRAKAVKVMISSREQRQSTGSLKMIE